MMYKNKILPLLLFVLIAFCVPLQAQFQWQPNGLSIRQGTHLGWNGAALAVGDDIAFFYYHCDRDGTRDIWGQRRASDGSLLWGNSGILVSGDLSEQRYPVSAVYSDGSILVVWEDYSAGRYRNLMAQRYDASGNPLWSPALGVSIVVGYRDQYEPHVAIDENNYAYVIFTDDRETSGEYVRIETYGQVIMPSGQIVGPLDGIHLMDRQLGSNLPVDVIAYDGAAYALMTSSNGIGDELVLQKILSDGSLAWPEDPAIIIGGYPSNAVLLKINGGMAIGWTDRQQDMNGDARLLLADYNRAPFNGWPDNGIVVASGDFSETVVSMAEAPDGGIAVALASYEFNPDESNLSVKKYNINSSLSYGPIDFGTASLLASPADLVWQDNDLIVAWSEQFDETSHTLRTQKLSSTGVKLWGNNGNSLFTRNEKVLRGDLVKPQNGNPSLLMLSGRTTNQPESLFVSTLNANGQLAEAPALVAGGVTYSSYNQKVVRIAEDRALVAWSDARDRVFLDVYAQIVTNSGSPLLSQQGRKLTNGTENIQFPPAVASDGQGGGFVAWISDSLGSINFLNVRYISPAGEVVGYTARLTSTIGYQGNIYMTADDFGNCFVAFSEYNSEFAARVKIAKVTNYLFWEWEPDVVAFDGPAGKDVAINDIASDGQGGVFVAATVGSWLGSDISVYHLNTSGQPGDGWTMEGITLGDPNRIERNPHLINLNTNGNGVVLTYQKEQDASSLSDIMGTKINTDGSRPWGQTPRVLSSPSTRAYTHQLSDDGQGCFYLCWEDYRVIDQSDIYVSRFTFEGNPFWTPSERLVCQSEFNQTAPSITHDDAGGVWVAWDDDRERDEYGEDDMFATHINGITGNFETLNGFSWPAEGQPMCRIATPQRYVQLIPWIGGSALALWNDSRSSNPGRCCGAGSVGDIFENIYGQVMSEFSLAADEGRPTIQPESFEISSVYPNPFNPSTAIEYILPKSAKVKLSVYNLLGQEVETLFNGSQTAGTHSITWNAAHQTSGLYFAKLEAENKTSVKKLMLMK